MPRFPDAAAHAADFTDRIYTALASRAEAADRVFPLNVGDTYLEPPDVARVAAIGREDRGALHRYAPVQGVPALLEAIRDRLRARTGEDVPVERLQVMSGATAGLNVVCQVLLEPGDELILPTPSWPLARGLATARGAKTVEVPFYTRLADPSFDPERALEAAVTERSVAIYVNTPHNPTGVVLDDEVLAAVARVAARHDLWVLTDEAYQDLWYTDDAPRAAWARGDLRDRAIATHTLSKSYAYAGARVGYVHGPDEIMARIRGMQTYVTYCAPTPLQWGAAGALAEGESFLASCRSAYRAASVLASQTLGVSAPAGGTFVFADVSRLLDGGEDATPVLEACADRGVVLTPGASCGADYGAWVRLCYTAVPPDALAEAMTRIAPIFAPLRAG